MKSDDLLKAIGDADKKYVEEADKFSSDVTDIEKLKETKENTVPEAQKKHNKNITKFSQVYRAILSLAAAIVLIFIFVSALNIYKKNNTKNDVAATSSSDTSGDTVAGKDTQNELALLTEDSSSENNDSQNDIADTDSYDTTSSYEENDSFDTASSADSDNSSDTGSSASENIDDTSNNGSDSLSSTKISSDTNFVTAKGDGYSFSVEVPDGFTWYSFLGKSTSGDSAEDFLPNDPCIVIHPAPTEENDSYMLNGNVIIIYFPESFGVSGTGLSEKTVTFGKNKGIMGTFKDTPQAFDYITFMDDIDGIVVLNRSDWYSTYEKEMDEMFSSIKLQKK